MTLFRNTYLRLIYKQDKLRLNSEGKCAIIRRWHRAWRHH